jgi:hypothetical protein
MKTAELQTQDISEERLRELGLGYLASPQDVSPLPKEYIIARMHEAKGDLANKEGDIVVANGEYGVAMAIFERLGLFGDSLRMANRRGHYNEITKYEQKVKELMEENQPRMRRPVKA